jgi:tRNA pseudouridine55 synthase
MAPLTPHLSGILNINKSGGLTSHDVVAKIRKLTGQRKAGHAGTLDPMATGVLLVCLGQATRLIEYLVPGRKQYRATIRFGQETDTLDADGEIVAQAGALALTETRLRQLLPAFTGTLQQIPPIYSAIKQAGQPLYKRARAGETVEVAPRPITIFTIEWVAWQPPDLIVDVTCSPGTYIRSLARDLGQAAQTGAHLAALSRTASGRWSLAGAVSLETLTASPATWTQYLHPPHEAVAHLPAAALNPQTTLQVQYGQQVSIPVDDPEGDLLRAYTEDGRFLAILTRTEAGAKLWQPKKVFIPGNA